MSSPDCRRISLVECAMSQIVVLPHVQLCPDGAVIVADPMKTICDNLLANGVMIEHACEKSCACTTCHILIREGFDAIAEADDLEEDMLDKAWGLEPVSRLSCQALVPCDTDLVVEMPRYTINHAKEGS